ncbi:MAG: hypothetical protein LBR94_02830 [Desulfovibrio sp.]|jgi:hypothetical protein|nr:hypothetical protein [Desulfovibrio sp.]
MLTEEERRRFLEAIETAPNRKVANLMLLASIPACAAMSFLDTGNDTGDS